MIHLLKGRPGEGKTWTITSLIPKFLLEGKIVGVNFELDLSPFPELAEFAGNIRLVKTFAEILRFKDGVLFLDEAQVWFNNREWKEVPLDLQNKWQQHRKHRIDIFICAQDQSRVEVTIRQLIGRYFAVTKWWRIFIIKEYEPKINAETQMIEKEEVLDWWIQFSPVKLLDPKIRFGKIEMLKLGWRYPVLIYQTHKEVDFAKDAKHDGSKSVSDLEQQQQQRKEVRK